MIRFSTHDKEETVTQAPLFVLDEAFDKPYPARLTVHKRGNDFYYRSKFNLDDGGYVTVLIDSSTHADDDEELQWQLSFVRNGNMNKTGEGDAMRIFATVVKLVNDFIKKESPKYVTLAAQKDRQSGEIEKSREKLYDRMIKRYYGSKFKVQKYPSSHETTWYLSK